VTRNLVSNWLAELSKRIGLEGWSLLQLGRVGDLRPVPAHRLAAMLRAVSDCAMLGAATRITALRDPRGVALIDERGALSFTDDAGVSARGNRAARDITWVTGRSGYGRGVGQWYREVLHRLVFERTA